jgi:hypothetical protein
MTATSVSVAEGQRAAYITGLRKLADVLDVHPDVPLPHDGHKHGRLPIYTHGAAQFAAAARAIGGAKGTSHDGRLQLRATLDGLHVTITDLSGEVCRKIVDTVEVVEDIPDPDVVAAAVANAPRVQQTRVETIERWECPPSVLALAPRAEAVAA